MLRTACWWRRGARRLEGQAVVPRRTRARDRSSCGCSLLDTDLNGESGRLPLRESFGEALDLASSSPQEGNRAVGVRAVRPPAIGNVLPVFRKLAQARLQLVERKRDGPRDVSGCVLVRRTRI